MPRLIDAPAGDSISPADLAETLATTRIDPRDEDAVASLAPLLARLQRNRTFLADAAIGELKRRCSGQSSSGYGAQVFLLPSGDRRFTVRANFWPAAQDAVLRASGTASFVYGMAHDHDFDFLTIGYLGPGYSSEDYLYDAMRLTGAPGEAAGLRPQGMSQLRSDRVLLYRRHLDVHRQHPPDAFSVSLNILVRHPDQPWTDQLQFDVEADRVLRTLTSTPAEALLGLAVQLDIENAREVAEACAFQHRSPRMRRMAMRALIEVSDARDRVRLLEQACAAPDRVDAARARAALSDMVRNGEA